MIDVFVFVIVKIGFYMTSEFELGQIATQNASRLSASLHSASEKEDTSALPDF